MNRYFKHLNDTKCVTFNRITEIVKELGPEHSKEEWCLLEQKLKDSI